MKRLLVAVPLIALTACSASKHISAQELGSDYPFTVDGYLECESPGALLFKAQGQTYAINGTAQAKGYADIAPVWKETLPCRVPRLALAKWRLRHGNFASRSSCR